MREPSASAATAAEILDRLGGRWALVGALAALRYRTTPRLTTDVDILAEWRAGLVEAFETAGYQVTVRADPGEAPHLLLVRGHGDQIDILLPVIAYQEVALERAQDHVITVEDVIVHKLIAWRPRDRNDIASILEAGHNLDVEYIERWAAEWDVSDRWRQAKAAR
ncbi:MAG: hypothetical protein ACRDZ7_19260 [Acidimicrobiia bacterium]